MGWHDVVPHGQLPVFAEEPKGLRMRFGEGRPRSALAAFSIFCIAASTSMSSATALGRLAPRLRVASSACAVAAANSATASIEILVLIETFFIGV